MHLWLTTNTLNKMQQFKTEHLFATFRSLLVFFFEARHLFLLAILVFVRLKCLCSSDFDQRWQVWISLVLWEVLQLFMTCDLWTEVKRSCQKSHKKTIESKNCDNFFLNLCFEHKMGSRCRNLRACHACACKGPHASHAWLRAFM